MTGNPIPASGGGARFVGQRVPRHEDLRFLTGRGAFVDDIYQPEALHVAFARSHAARGKIVSVDTEAAAAMPGVAAVFVASDLNHLVREWWVDLEGPKVGSARPFRLLAEGDVRFVGEPITMVLADSRYRAEDAVDAVEIDIEWQTPVIDIEQAAYDDAPRVHGDSRSNVGGMLPESDTAEIDAVLQSAPRVLTETFRQHRYACVPMETHGILATWDPFSQELTVWASTQGPHSLRGQLARAMGIEDSQVRVIMPDVGGAFGLKMLAVPEEIAVALAARQLSRPVKWIEDRREHLMAGQHAREDQATVTFALSSEGRILAAKVDFLEGLGAFPAAMSSATGFAAMMFPGPYRIPKYASSGRSVYTNTAPRGSYRGPWMIETVARELMMDRVAAQMGIDPLELRRRNAVREEDMPYTTATGMVYDQMTAAANLEQAAEIVGYAQFREQQGAWREQGRLVGIGISLLTEPSAIAMGWQSTEAATVRMGPSGKVDVVTSAASHGQSLETTIAQVVADELSIDMNEVRVIQGDTAVTPVGSGTGGSRSAVLCSGAAREAAQQVRSQILMIAAHRMEAAPDDLEIVDGRIQVAGTPTQGMTIAAVARRAYSDTDRLPPGQPLGLEGQSRYKPSSTFTWSNACHICVCEVDPATGSVEILRYVVSEDCGVMINPSVVEGQIAGGVVQGIGGVLYEHIKYDNDGNPLATTFVDYLLPTAAEVPVIEYGHIETPAPTNAGGYKGMGEGGAMASPPAVMNAVADAVAHLGVVVRDQPLGPAEVVALLTRASDPLSTKEEQ
ncbi:MAG: xanthine dehydrogenase family protein molybdopterin-binding subunit [Acidimicrobiales bacterium]